MKRKKFIFRWKDDGTEVIPSVRPTVDEVWEFAEKWLYPATMTPEQGRNCVRLNGEVIEVSE